MDYQTERNIAFDKRWCLKDDCWEWTGATRAGRYGAIWDKRKGSMVAAHRFSYERFIGEIPEGLVVMHMCDNGMCVNPEHLKVGTQQENVHDCISKGRQSDKSGELNGNSKLTKQQVIDIFKSARSIVDLSIDYGVSLETVRHIKNGVKWKHVTDFVEYDPK